LTNLALYTVPKHHIFATPFASVYPLYVQKAERKHRTKAEVDQIICWLTGYSQAGLQRQIEQENDFETFFRKHQPCIQRARISQASYVVFAWKKSKIR
jgi:hypothetical protein